MDAEELARTLVSALPTGVPGLFNPWADVCGEDLGSNGPDAKQRRLQQHLDCDVEFILCGEAAGWQGMRHTGLAFTSERCRRRSKSEPPCRPNIEPGVEASLDLTGCG